MFLHTVQIDMFTTGIDKLSALKIKYTEPKRKLDVQSLKAGVKMKAGAIGSKRIQRWSF